jgi:hypothetical protein
MSRGALAAWSWRTSSATQGGALRVEPVIEVLAVFSRRSKSGAFENLKVMRGARSTRPDCGGKAFHAAFGLAQHVDQIQPLRASQSHSYADELGEDDFLAHETTLAQ